MAADGEAPAATTSRFASAGLSAFAVILYCTVGPSLIFVNKHIMSGLGFAYPMSVSGLGVLSSAALSHALVRTGAVELEHAAVVDRAFWLRRILPVGLTISSTLYFGNAAYVHLSVAFIQMMKAFAPVITMAMMFVFRLERPTCLLVSSILIISFGTAVAGYGELHFSPVGVALLMTSELIGAAQLVIQQLVLDDMKFPVVEGLYYMMPAASFFIVVWAGALEWPEMVEKDGLAIVQEHPHVFGAAALLGFVVNFSGFLVVKLLGGLSLKVISTLRNAAVVVASAYVFEEVVTATEALGYAVSTLGIALFHYAKLRPDAGGGLLCELAAEVGRAWRFAIWGKHAGLEELAPPRGDAAFEQEVAVV